jgi:hypothetical protein
LRSDDAESQPTGAISTRASAATQAERMPQA